MFTGLFDFFGNGHFLCILTLICTGYLKLEHRCIYKYLIYHGFIDYDWYIQKKPSAYHQRYECVLMRILHYEINICLVVFVLWRKRILMVIRSITANRVFHTTCFQLIFLTHFWHILYTAIWALSRVSNDHLWSK